MFVCQLCATSFPEDGYCAHDGSPLRAAKADPLIGATVGPYRIEKLIGVGGMGQVYKAVHPKIGSRVAVKVLAQGPSTSNDLIARFFDEARAVNVIRHENIVNILDLDSLPDGRPYIVMEFLDGAPLTNIIANHSPLPIGTVLRMVEEVLSALDAAHGKEIVHRDLKPDNIFISPKGRPKVLDFGIAKLSTDQKTLQSKTQEGSLLGTPHYMPPEQALAKDVDTRSDIYSIGVILYECLTGKTPFESESLFELLQQHVSTPAPSPRILRPEIPPGLEAIIMRALEKDPDRRWQNVRDFSFALQQQQQGLPEIAWAPIASGSESSSAANRPSKPPSGAGPLGAPLVSTPANTAHRGPRSRWMVALPIVLGVAALGGVIALSQMEDATTEVSEAGDNAVVSAAPGESPALIPATSVDGNEEAPTIAAEPGSAAAPPPLVPPTALKPSTAATPTKPTAAKPTPTKPTPTKPTPTKPTKDKPTPTKPTKDKPASTPVKPPEVVIKPTPPNAVPMRDATATKAPASFDVSGYLPKAYARARKAFPDAVLVRIDADGVMPNGKANLTLSSDFGVLYRFISPSRSKRPASLPLGVEHKPTCLFYVSVSPKATDNYALEGWKCSDYKRLRRPRCSAKKIWQRAIADGAPKSNAVAEIGLRSGQWWFDIKDTYSKRFPDDC